MKGITEDTDDKSASTADWRNDPHSVLELVDEQLAAFGLEVVMIETYSDEYKWKIVKRDATDA